MYWIVTELFYPDEVSTAQILTDIAVKKNEQLDVSIISGPSGYESSYAYQKRNLNDRIIIYRVKLPSLNKNILIQRIFRLLLLTAKLSWNVLTKVKKDDTVLFTTNPTFLVLILPFVKRLKGFNLELLVHDVFPDNLVPAGLMKSDSRKFKLLSRVYSSSYKKVDRIIRLFDYVIGDEGYNLFHYGIEGTTWKKEGDKIVLTPLKDADGKEIPLTVTYPITNVGFIAEWSGTRQWTAPTIHPELQKMSSDLNGWFQANAKPVPTDLRISLLDIPDRDKDTEKIKDDIIKCILSNNVEATWNEIVKGYRANGYDKIIEETNAECAKAGIK